MERELRSFSEKDVENRAANYRFYRQSLCEEHQRLAEPDRSVEINRIRDVIELEYQNMGIYIFSKKERTLGIPCAKALPRPADGS